MCVGDPAQVGIRSARVRGVPGFDAEIRRIGYSTNAIESLNARIRRAVRATGHFPNERAELKCIYLAVRALDPTGKGRPDGSCDGNPPSTLSVSTGNEFTDWSGEVTSSGHLPRWFDPDLAWIHFGIRGGAVFDESQTTANGQYAYDLGESQIRIGERARRPGGHHRVEAGVGRRPAMCSSGTSGYGRETGCRCCSCRSSRRGRLSLCRCKGQIRAP